MPVVFVSGDAGLCRDAEALIPDIATVAVKEGVGNSTINIHPHLAQEKTRDAVRTALTGDVSRCRLEMPEQFAVEIGYKDHARAFRASFFPGAGLKEPHAIQFETRDYFEVLRLLLFVL